MTYRIENPATGVVEKEFDSTSDADVRAAVERAHAAFDTWHRESAQTRADAMKRVADAYDERADELARTIATEMGKPLTEAKGEVELAG